MTLAQLGEFGLIDLLSQGAPVGEGVLIGIGDDTAVVQATPGRELLLTCDLLHEGVHFRRHWYADHPGLLGRKALAVSISDIASKGGQPRYCLISLAAGQDLTAEFLRDLFAGLYDLARECGISVVGGDTVGLSTGLLLDVFLTGEIAAGGALLRSAARPGDLIAVTGYCGLARAGLQLLEVPGAASDLPLSARQMAIDGQLCPPIRLAAAKRMAATGLVHAMSDTSDGPANQVHHVCRQSGLGAIVDACALPVGEAAIAVAQACGADPLMWGLWGGEDYELLLTLAPAAYDALAAAAHDVPLTVIGEVTGSGSPILLRQPDGRTEPLAFGGYEHFGAASG